MENDEKRFYLLDGLRGIAAISVVIFHYTEHNNLHWLGGAWASVDLFFILSGFVIAHSYGLKIVNGLSFQNFFLIRLIRLGPLYFIGLLIGLAAAFFAQPDTVAPEITNKQIFTAFSLGLVLVPYINDGYWSFGKESIQGSIFPLNDPAWSLFFEVFINIIFFVFVKRTRKTSSKKVVLLASGAFLMSIVLFKQINPGWGSENFIFGFPRVVAEFFAGALIYSTGIHCKKFHLPIVLTVSFSSVFLLTFGNLKIALINSMVFMPLAIIFLASVQTGEIIKYFCKFLGYISYPLYITHYPIYRLIYREVNIKSFTSEYQVLIIFFVTFLIILGFASVDVKVRKWLEARLINSKFIGSAVSR